MRAVRTSILAAGASILAVSIGLTAWSSAIAGEESRMMIELELDGQPLVGTPLDWSPGTVYLLSRDGWLWEFRPGEAANFRKSDQSFASIGVPELRSQLGREFGRDFDVTATGHYVVVHPAGQRDKWGRRFEELYRSFVHYFAVRGFDLQPPEFPLVAIVFRNQNDFYRYAAREGTAIGPGVLGYYSPKSNRVALFDQSGGRDDDATWAENAATIIHEATHQTAFNTGIHSRFAEQPRWVVEGLGTMFEAPGVWDSARHRQRSDRINHGRLTDFRSYVAGGRPGGSLKSFIASDRPFAINPIAAYAEAWALCYWLVETRPRQFAEYLSRVADREPFESYDPAERVEDFAAVFGDDFNMLDAQFVRWIEKNS